MDAQLESASLTNEQYEYDKNGNRINGNFREPPKNTGANRLLYDGVYTYEYDDEGKRTKKASSSSDYEAYFWDNRNRLIAGGIQALQQPALRGRDVCIRHV